MHYIVSMVEVGQVYVNSLETISTLKPYPLADAFSLVKSQQAIINKVGHYAHIFEAA